ncbi:pentapeptide repeat-containing protein [Chloroflexota bacterium]
MAEIDIMQKLLNRDAAYHTAWQNSGGLHVDGAKRMSFRAYEMPNVVLRFANICTATFSGCALSGADFFSSMLRDCAFSHANLQNANLSEACFVDADFRGADLRGADLSRSDFRYADLRGADLRGAKLWGATFHWANTTDAKFDEFDIQMIDAWPTGLHQKYFPEY